jgi:hypothetical protein
MSSRLGQRLPRLPAPLALSRTDQGSLAVFDRDGDGKPDAFMTSGVEDRRAHTTLRFLDEQGRTELILGAVDGIVRYEEQILWRADGKTGLAVAADDACGCGRADVRHFARVRVGQPHTLAPGLPPTAGVAYDDAYTTDPAP